MYCNQSPVAKSFPPWRQASGPEASAACAYTARTPDWFMLSSRPAPMTILLGPQMIRIWCARFFGTR